MPSTEGWGFHYEKFQRVAQAWAVVGAWRRSSGGTTDTSPSPDRAHQHGLHALRATSTEAALTGADAEAGRGGTGRRGGGGGHAPLVRSLG